jgi:hypothetical protein
MRNHLIKEIGRVLKKKREKAEKRFFGLKTGIVGTIRHLGGLLRDKSKIAGAHFSMAAGITMVLRAVKSSLAVRMKTAM